MVVLDYKADRPPIRHIISLDGTWQTGNQDTPSNVKLMHDSFAEYGEDGKFQKTKYFDGVATKGSFLRRVWNGVTGADLEQKVCEAYEYLS